MALSRPEPDRARIRWWRRSARCGRERTEKPKQSGRLRGRSETASQGCSAYLGGTLLTLALVACGTVPQPSVHVATPPSPDEGYCAWFGDARRETLYFGESAFWAAMRRTGRPEGDLEVLGPVRIGRFDLAARELLDPLPIAAREASGTWDVLAHPNGRVYFTTYFGAAGFVDPATGEVVRFGAETLGLNELALGPQDRVLATRYGGLGGSVVALAPDGAIVEELVLEPPAGYRVAAKSVAWDPVREEIWVNTDLLPEAQGPIRHDARVLDAQGRERLRFDTPELQFVVFEQEGTGYLAVREGSVLALLVLPRGRETPLADAQRWLLDERFPADHDFVQDLQLTADGGVVATRWSGRIHWLRGSELRTFALPRPLPDGLYYTAVLAGDHLCATFCGGVSVVCRRID